jgi:hypothetical protein
MVIGSWQGGSGLGSAVFEIKPDGVLDVIDDGCTPAEHEAGAAPGSHSIR